MHIPFNKPFIAGKELHYIAQAVTLGNIGGDGYFTRKCAELMQDRFGIHKVLLTPSCTAALEMAAMLCDLEPDDEVIMPSYTFVSTANAFVRVGAKPIFVDIRPDTLNIDETLIEDAITERTKAICVVHYAGVGCEMDRIMAIARGNGLRVIEDAAQGVNAFYKGRALGSIGDLGCYSFHETKNYICGEGGALCINDPELVQRAEIIRDKGTNRQKFFRGEVDKYTWVDVGSSYVPSEICSAFLWGQLEQLDEIARRRRQIYQRYRNALNPLAEEGLLQLSQAPEDCDGNHHMVFVTLPSADARDLLLQQLRARAINAVFHYIPLHTSPMGPKICHDQAALPVTEELSARLLRLPMYYEISNSQIDYVAATIGQLLHPPQQPSGSIATVTPSVEMAVGPERRQEHLTLLEQTRDSSSMHSDESSTMIELSIVTTLYNSADFILEFYNQISRCADGLVRSWELVLVDDGSPDESAAIAAQITERDPRVALVELSRNFGHHQAIMAGLSHARGKQVFLIDVDLEEQPQWLADFMSVASKSEADVVRGRQELRGDGWANRMTANLFYRAFNSLSHMPIEENPCTVRLMSRRYVDALLSMGERSLYLAGNFEWVGFHQESVVVRKARRTTSSNYTFRRKVALFANAITSFSAYPLQIIFVCGVVITLASGSAGVAMIINRVVAAESVQMGWSSIMVSIWFLGGMIIAFLGIMAQYLSKVFTEVKARPLYFVKRVLNGRVNRGPDTPGFEPWSEPKPAVDSCDQAICEASERSLSGSAVE